jgi:hypothetical protein
MSTCYAISHIPPGSVFCWDTAPLRSLGSASSRSSQSIRGPRSNSSHHRSHFSSGPITLGVLNRTGASAKSKRLNCSIGPTNSTPTKAFLRLGQFLRVPLPVTSCHRLVTFDISTGWDGIGGNGSITVIEGKGSACPICPRLPLLSVARILGTLSA